MLPKIYPAIPPSYSYSYLAPSKASESDEWKRKLEANKASAMTTAEAFTREFVDNSSLEVVQEQSHVTQSAASSSSVTTTTTKKEVTFAEQHQEFSAEPPVLPPKTKIMHSPSR